MSCVKFESHGSKLKKKMKDGYRSTVWAPYDLLSRVSESPKCRMLLSPWK